MMKLNFEEAITGYEFIAICISILALLEPLLIFLWKRYIQKGKLKYYSNGSIDLFFNRSGSYVRFFGTLQAENKDLTVKKISLNITRLKDHSERNLLWSSFISPYTQSVGGNFLFTDETVHPFNLDTKNVHCAFLEFADSSKGVYKEYCNIIQQNESEMKGILLTNNYESAMKLFKNTNCYNELHKLLDKDFFWEIGKYSFELIIEYNSTSKKYSFNFSINETENNIMKNNMKETLYSQIKEFYKCNGNYKSCSIDVHETLS